MSGELHKLLSRDHERLDSLLSSMVKSDGSIDYAEYEQFRGGLLWHIGVEERVLFPEIRKRRGDSPEMQQLHRDHAALSALLVPPPTAKEIDEIRAILTHHNPIEEDAGGLYDTFEELTGGDLAALLERIRRMPPVPLAPHADSHFTRNAIAQLLREAEEGRRRLRER